MPSPTELVVAFNDAITARNLDALTALMTEDHVFTDTAGGTVRGREACRDAWAGFFAAFPDYRNDFTTLAERGWTVRAIGRSQSAEAALDGPALWVAQVRASQVASWRVYEDTPDNRTALGLS